MDLGFDGLVAFVSGGSGGIGAATAELLAREGADIIIGYNANRVAAERTAATVQQLGRRSWLCQMDLTDPVAVEKGLANLPHDASRLDALILCAGEAPVNRLSEMTSDEWKRVIDVNLNGPFHLLRASCQLLNDDASVVIVASVAAQTGVPHQAHYAAAKAGLVNLTKSAAREFAPRIRVNCVAPGMTLTAMGARTAAGLPPDYAKQKLLVQRFAQPDEIARCVAFLASPLTGFVTGATLDANGGRYLR
jgi:3-oxoacyl-[acyl-carrier protein] reductase